MASLVRLIPKFMAVTKITYLHLIIYIKTFLYNPSRVYASKYNTKITT